jgi:hypothetical protein
MAYADNTVRRSGPTNRARRLLLYSFGLASVLGVVVGVLTMTEDWRHGLTLVGGVASGMTVCAAAIRGEIAADLRRLRRKRRRDRRP